MRESMLNDLYYGRISPWERPRVCTYKYKKISKKIIDIEEHFRNFLSPEEFAKFKELQGLRGQAEAIESANVFEHAFRTGALMIIDVFCYEEND